MQESKQEYINEETRKDIDQLYSHATIANKEMGVIKQDISEIKTDLEWLKRFFWIIATASIGGLITGVLNLFWR